jgi:hypothetical protein
MEMIDGCFYRTDDVADELEVRNVVDEPARLLHGRFSPARRQWSRAGRRWRTARTSSPSSSSLSLSPDAAVFLEGGDPRPVDHR